MRDTDESGPSGPARRSANASPSPARSPNRERASTISSPGGQYAPSRRLSIPSSPSIGIRRLNSSVSVRSSQSRDDTIDARIGPLPSPGPQASHGPDYTSIDFAPRRRSSSEPRPMAPLQPLDTDLARTYTNIHNQASAPLPTLSEESRTSSGLQGSRETRNGYTAQPNRTDEAHVGTPARRKTITERAMGGLGSLIPGRGPRERSDTQTEEVEYNQDLVNLLDVIDPEVSTLSTLTNVQNSLFIPDLGRLINRRPTYNLTALSPRVGEPPRATTEAEDLQEKVDEEAEAEVDNERDSDLATITSHLSESRYAVLPHGVSLDGWTVQEKEQLDDHVRHMLHSKRAAFRRGMKGFGQYVRRPLGFFVTLYATLITLFGFAWVLFLIGWVNLGARRDYIINVIDNILVALFAVMGDGLIPFRIIDTYHMAYIAHYHHLSWRLRKQAKLPKLPNHNDLPNTLHPTAARGPSIDLEALRPTSSCGPGDPEYYSVLTEAQQRKLEHHQAKFMKSHTFYKPHETETHYAFPLRLLVAIVTILDFHSVFQVALGVCTWSIPYKTRPFVLTTVILCCSITCNVTGGVLISIGDRRTRKKEVRERMFRQQLTEKAIRDVQKSRYKEVGLEAVPEVRDERDEADKAAERQRRVDAKLGDDLDGWSGPQGKIIVHDSD